MELLQKEKALGPSEISKNQKNNKSVPSQNPKKCLKKIDIKINKTYVEKNKIKKKRHHHEEDPPCSSKLFSNSGM